MWWTLTFVLAFIAAPVRAGWRPRQLAVFVPAAIISGLASMMFVPWLFDTPLRLAGPVGPEGLAWRMVPVFGCVAIIAAGFNVAVRWQKGRWAFLGGVFLPIGALIICSMLGVRTTGWLGFGLGIVALGAALALPALLATTFAPDGSQGTRRATIAVLAVVATPLIAWPLIWGVAPWDVAERHAITEEVSFTVASDGPYEVRVAMPFLGSQHWSLVMEHPHQGDGISVSVDASHNVTLTGDGAGNASFRFTYYDYTYRAYGLGALDLGALHIHAVDGEAALGVRVTGSIGRCISEATYAAVPAEPGIVLPAPYRPGIQPLTAPSCQP